MTGDCMDKERRRFVSRRRNLAALATMPLLAIGAPGTAIAAGKKRLAFLNGANREEFLAEKAPNIGKALAEFGWQEGKNLEILWRFTEGDEARVPALVKEIVAAKPDVIWVSGGHRTRAVQQATRTIPIMAFVPDAVLGGFAQSLARPGGNITGLSHGVRETQEKMVELLRLVLPRLQAVAVVIPAEAAASFAKFPPVKGLRLETVLGEARIDGKVHTFASIEDVRSILRTLPKDGRGAAVLWPPGKEDPRAVAQAAIELRVPMMAYSEDLVERGALMSFQLYYDDDARSMVAIVDKLLRGADPATIPFEFPNRSLLAINRKTAAAIGVRFPAEIVLRADKVFD